MKYSKALTGKQVRGVWKSEEMPLLTKSTVFWFCEHAIFAQMLPSAVILVFRREKTVIIISAERLPWKFQCSSLVYWFSHQVLSIVDCDWSTAASVDMMIKLVCVIYCNATPFFVIHRARKKLIEQNFGKLSTFELLRFSKLLSSCISWFIFVEIWGNSFLIRSDDLVYFDYPKRISKSKVEK